MMQPTCDECPWRGTPTFDHAEAVAQCREHHDSEHFSLWTQSGDPS